MSYHATKRHAEIGKIQAQVWKLLLTAVLVIWLPLFVLAGWRMWRDRVPDDLPEITLAKGQNLVLNTSKLRPRQTEWFTYLDGIENIHLLVQRDGSGTMRAVYGSCTTCYSTRSNNEWSNGTLICGRCRHAMRLGDPEENLTRAKGCVAVPVPFRIDNAKLVVLATDIEAHARDFRTEAGSSKKVNKDKEN